MRVNLTAKHAKSAELLGYDEMPEYGFPVGVGVGQYAYSSHQSDEYDCDDGCAPPHQRGRYLSEQFPHLLRAKLYVVMAVLIPRHNHLVYTLVSCHICLIIGIDLHISCLIQAGSSQDCSMPLSSQ